MKEAFEKAIKLIKENTGRLCRTALCLSVLAAGCIWLCYSMGVVKVNDGENSSTLVTVISDEEGLMDLAGVKLAEKDSVMYTSFEGNYRDLTVRRAYRVPVTADGGTTDALINGGTVGECLELAGVNLDENDYTVPSIKAPVKSGDRIRVYRVEYMDNQYEEDVPYETNYKYSSLLYKNKWRNYTLQDGKNGKNLVTYRERYVDGELELALISKVEVIEKPVERVVLAYGKEPVSPLEGPPGVTVSGGVPTGYSRLIPSVRATGYTASRGRGASGLGLYCGTVAVNPAVIPYGTKMYISSTDGQFIYGWAIATDTGGSLLNGSVGVDLFYDTYTESLLNGVITVNIYVY